MPVFLIRVKQLSFVIDASSREIAIQTLEHNICDYLKRQDPDDGSYDVANETFIYETIDKPTWLTDLHVHKDDTENEEEYQKLLFESSKTLKKILKKAKIVAEFTKGKTFAFAIQSADRYE